MQKQSFVDKSAETQDIEMLKKSDKSDTVIMEGFKYWRRL